MADRLTKIIEDGPISVLSVCQARVEDVTIWKEWSASKDSSIEEALLRLASYEDLGPVEELAALKERTRWIPVSERLPNMCGFKCLVCAKNKFEQTHVFTAFTGYMEHWKLEFHSCEPPYDDLSAWEITHWMPLLEAPKEAQS